MNNSVEYWKERAEAAEEELASANEQLRKLREQEPVTFVHDPNGYACNGMHTEIYDALEVGMDLYAAPKPAAPAVPEATCNDNLQVPREWREMLEFLISQRGKAGHSHRRPGIWDSDNGVLAGKPCAECAMYDRARALLGAKP